MHQVGLLGAQMAVTNGPPRVAPNARQRHRMHNACDNVALRRADGTGRVEALGTRCTCHSSLRSAHHRRTQSTVAHKMFGANLCAMPD